MESSIRATLSWDTEGTNSIPLEKLTRPSKDLRSSCFSKSLVVAQELVRSLKILAPALRHSSDNDKKISTCYKCMLSRIEELLFLHHQFIVSPLMLLIFFALFIDLRSTFPQLFIYLYCFLICLKRQYLLSVDIRIPTRSHVSLIFN